MGRHKSVQNGIPAVLCTVLAPSPIYLICLGRCAPCAFMTLWMLHLILLAHLSKGSLVHRT
jgi:hypothetical protein